MRKLEILIKLAKFEEKCIFYYDVIDDVIIFSWKIILLNVTKTVKKVSCLVCKGIIINPWLSIALLAFWAFSDYWDFGPEARAEFSEKWVKIFFLLKFTVRSTIIRMSSWISQNKSNLMHPSLRILPSRSKLAVMSCQSRMSSEIKLTSQQLFNSGTHPPCYFRESFSNTFNSYLCFETHFAKLLTIRLRFMKF